jgi:hypothetical protein
MPRTKRPAIHLHPPTPDQLACAHDWEVTHSRTSVTYWWSPWPRRRYVRCRHCDLRVRTVETLEVPWAIEGPWDWEALKTHGWPR